MSFVIIGGGPTGVEMAGAIAELARKALSADFRSIDPRSTRVTLIEAGSRLLASFHPNLSEAARRSLDKLAVDVRLGKAATRCDEFGVEVDGERIEAANIIWAAGVMASPANRWLGVQGDRAGRAVREIRMLRSTRRGLEGHREPGPFRPRPSRNFRDRRHR